MTDTWIMSGIVAVGVAVMALLLWAGMAEQKQWDEFVTEHHCVVIGHEQGGAATGVASNGKVAVIFLPDKTTYKCDNGLTYTRAN